MQGHKSHEWGGGGELMTRVWVAQSYAAGGGGGRGRLLLEIKTARLSVPQNLHYLPIMQCCC